ncbi:MAG: helix-hairpin-helix domain-containing protein [Mediterranea sp.]|jgi:competence ComEA-like helix-hairpin-helix protein|nr:helix-hairpin-helix domain-containing protein [Mediterranea sp.]
MWKDFFYFSRSEKQGIIVLLILIALVILIGSGLSVYRKQKEPVYPENIEEEYNRFMASLKKQDSIEAQKRLFVRNDYKRNIPRQPVILQHFDPNITDSITFCRMGLQPWIAKNILRYRAKGGKFRRPEDFRKIYGLSEEQYTTLLPYIYISDKFQRKDTIRMASEQRYRAPDTITRPFKYPAGTMVNLNTADTAELKKIPGIGSGIAKRIVSYRNRLGGFYHVSQLQEINLNVDEFSNWFGVEDGEITRINLNKVSIERLKAHPYFNFYQAKAIVEYRKRKGDLKRLDQLAFYDEFTDKDMERMKHYACFE